MNKFIAIVVVAIIGVSFASGRIVFIGNDPKTWSPNKTVVTPPPIVNEHELEDFIEIKPEILCEKVCPPKKKFSWFW